MSQADRYLIVGGSGSGKTVLAGMLIDELAERHAFNRLVVLSTDEPGESPLADRCQHRHEVSNELAAKRIDLRRFLRDQGAAGVYLEVTAIGPDRVAFLDALGQAVMELGDVLVVIDEAHAIADRHAQLGFLEIWTRGRKRNVTPIAITQSLKQSPQVGLNPTVLRLSTVLVVFSTPDPTGHQQEQIIQTFPRIAPYLADLRDPKDGDAPEYGVQHSPTGRAYVRLRSGDVDLTQPSSQPAAVSA